MAIASQGINSAASPLKGAAFDVLLLVARVCLGFQFLFFGTKKFMNPPSIAHMIASHGLPGDLIYLVIPFQLSLGTLMILGLFTRIPAMGLAFFCTFAPAIFWAYVPDNFSRDLGSACGFLLIYAAGPGRFSLDRVFNITCERIFGAESGGAREMSILLAIARCFLSVEFIVDAIRKMLDMPRAGAFFEAHGLAASLVYPAIAFELALAALLILGLRTRPVAVAGIVTALILLLGFHGPASGPGYMGELFWGIYPLGDITHWIGNFAKDLGTVGAFTALLAYGPGQLSADAARSKPGLQTAMA